MLLNIAFTIMGLLGLHADTSAQFSDSELTELKKYKQLLINIREENISPDSAQHEFQNVLQYIRTKFPNTNPLDSSIVFPLSKSSISAVGGSGNGFYARKFNLFDHKVKGSHPAHDIFIYDPDQDCLDNRKKAYVDVLSVGEGFVLAIEDTWTPSSSFKGGNYVWVYDVNRGDLWYYAHLRTIDVSLGQRVKTGQKLGFVGRTGSSAYNKRSDTHLHLMHLILNKDLLPKAHNYYTWLKKARYLKEPEN
jgi:peptidoglycan LD-endopeptidase LytH